MHGWTAKIETSEYMHCCKSHDQKVSIYTMYNVNAFSIRNRKAICNLARFFDKQGTEPYKN